jgi:hypothetical protein
MSNSRAKVAGNNGFDMYICKKAASKASAAKDGALYRISPEIPATTL